MLPARPLGLGGHAHAHKSVLRLELLHRFRGVIDEGEAGGLAATKLGSESENIDLVLAGLVEAGELVAKLLLGDVGSVGVKNVTISRKVSTITPCCP